MRNPRPVSLNPLFGSSLTDASRWRKAHQEYMDQARACRACLTDPRGYWRCASDDIRVKEAVGFWVQRARNAHDIAMGRKPVIQNFVAITSETAIQGELYAA